MALLPVGAFEQIATRYGLHGMYTLLSTRAMDTKRYYHSLRFKITVGLLLSVAVVLVVTSCLRYVSFRRFLMDNLDVLGADGGRIVRTQLTAYLRSRLILSAGSLVAILLVGNLAMSRVVIIRLRQFLRAVRSIGPASLETRIAVGGHDEIAELAEAFNQMADTLQRQAERLSTLNTLAATVSQSLDMNEVLRSSLDEVLALVRLGAGWITLRDDGGETARLAASRGLPESVAHAHAQCDWRRCICAGVFESGQPQVFQGGCEHPCPAVEHLDREGFVFRACVPLKSLDRVLGVMSLAGVSSNHTWLFAEDSLETLAAIGRQIGIAIENASLYEELRLTEALRRQLLDRGIDLQEEERRRIARELHDQTSQRLTSMLMTLGVLGETESLAEARAYAKDLREMAAQTLDEVHDLALELRPRLLDDLGLMAALRHYSGEFQHRFHIPVDLQVLGLDDDRLPAQVETGLYRIAQEALTNVAKHAGARSIGVLVERRNASVVMIVEDDGQGFDVPQVMGTYVHERNLGLYGMRERAFLLGGRLTIESAPAMGTSVFVEIPLE